MLKRVIERLSKALPHGGFARQVAVLTSGTLLGRALAVLAMPFLTRIYAPADFSVLATYAAILGILGVVACFRFEIAIPMPEAKAEAAALLIASLAGTVFISGLAALIITFAAEPIMALLPTVTSPVILWLIPLGVLMVGSYGAFQYWSTRTRQFTDIARTRVSQAAIGVGTMLALGWIGVGATGLVLGHMLMAGAGAIGLAIWAYRRTPEMFAGIDLHRVWTAARAYRRFPLWSMPEALANVAGLQIPILIIAAAAPEGEAGYLMVAMQVMLLPMGLIGTSIGQVYLSRAPDEHREGRLGTFTLSIIKRLALIGGLPIAIVGLTAPWTFPFVFGVDWARSGEIAAMMVPWIILQFVAAPVSISLHVLRMPVRALAVQASGLLARISGLLVALSYGSFYIEAMVLSSIIFYIVMLMGIVWTVRRLKCKAKHPAEISHDGEH